LFTKEKMVGASFFYKKTKKKFLIESFLKKMAAAVKKPDARKARGANVRGKDLETENLDQNQRDQREKGSRAKKTTISTEAAKSIPTRTLARRGGGGGGKRGACGPGQGTGRRRAGTAVKGKNKKPLFTPDQVKEIVNIALKLKTFLGRTYSLPEDFCKARRWVSLCQKTNGENGMN
jgi:hypothetical protein